MDFHELNRREFVRLAGLTAGLLTLPSCVWKATGAKNACAAPAAAAQASAALPSLGGAPDTHEGRTIAAFVDTIVPGAHRDPTCAPGGLDVGAAALFFDSALPAAGLISAIVLLLDSVSGELYPSRQLVALIPVEREAVVERVRATVDAMEFAIQLAKLAYFASPEAGKHLGYPGANGGYLRDPTLSFRRPMARELTRDGNYDSRP